MRVLEVVHAVFVGPLERGQFHQLHQPDLAGLAHRLFVEATLLPDDCLDQRVLHAELRRCVANDAVVTALHLIVPPPIKRGGIDDDQQ